MSDTEELLPVKTDTAIAPVAPEPHPLMLLQDLIERGGDADALAKLSDMALTWQDREMARAYAQAMNAAQKEMPVIVKDARNPHTRSPYATLESVQRTVKPVYTQHGFSISWGTEDCPIADHIRMVADVLHADGHSRQYRGDIPLDGTGAKGGQSAMNAPQATGSTYSYGQRYMLKLIFNLTIAGEDNDAQGKVETITLDQQDQLERLRAATNTDITKMLNWIQPGIKKLAEVPVSRFSDAMEMLKRKSARQAEKKGGEE